MHFAISRFWFCWILVLYSFLAFPLQGEDATSKDSIPVQIELVSEETALQGGHPIWVALHLKMDKDWHIYWKNPGDAGLTPEIEWKNPDGFSVDTAEWPIPKRFEFNGLIGYGYEHETWLLFQVTPPQTLTGTETQLSAKISWLACDENSCLPGTTPVTLKLPIGQGKPSDQAPSFAAARQLIPQKGSGIQAKAHGDLIEIKLPHVDSFTEADYFPEEGSAIDPKADPLLVKEEGGYRLLLRKGEQEEGKQPTSLKGVIALYPNGKSQGNAQAFEVQAQVTASDEPIALADQDGKPIAPFAVEESSSATGSFLVAFILAFIGGMILNLMPCVLPVISFKVLSFVKMADQDRTTTFKHGLSFSAGVILSFWVLAGLMILLQAYGKSVGWGFQLQEPLFVAFLAGLLLVFGLSLFGVFEMGAKITGMASQHSQEGLTGSFLSGILATAVATPCTGPFLGSAIGFAVTLPPLLSMLIFTSLGLGMAFPYLLLAFYPQSLRFLPKPGPWMVIFKELMGFFMIATVIWLVWVFGAQTSALGVVMLLFAFFFLALACWIWGKWGTPVSSSLAKKWSLGGVLLLALIAGSLIYSSTSPLVSAFASGEPANAVVWEDFSEARIAELERKGIPVFIDFTARWCLICQANHLVLDSKGVSKKMDEMGVVRMKADWTKNDEAITAALRRFGRNGVPLYVLYSSTPGSKPVILPQVLTPDLVIGHLDQLEEVLAEND